MSKQVDETVRVVPYYEDDAVTLFCADSREFLHELADESIAAVRMTAALVTTARIARHEATATRTP